VRGYVCRRDYAAEVLEPLNSRRICLVTDERGMRESVGRVAEEGSVVDDAMELLARYIDGNYINTDFVT
jgi:hypothetical protein